MTEIVGDEVILLDKKPNKKVRILYCLGLQKNIFFTKY
jgi:hypothetical protein